MSVGRETLTRWLALGVLTGLTGCAGWGAQPPVTSSYPTVSTAPASAPRSGTGPRGGSEAEPHSIGAPPEDSEAAPVIPADAQGTRTVEKDTAIIRGQSPAYPRTAAPPFQQTTPGSSNYTRQPMPVSGTPAQGGGARMAQAPGAPSNGAFNGAPPAPSSPPGYGTAPGYAAPPPVPQLSNTQNGLPIYGSPPTVSPPFVEDFARPPAPALPIRVDASETRTGRFMFGVGVNSELGVSGQVVIDERNFDWRRPPTSMQDIVNGTAWRGGGQGFRVEAMPGSQVQRYSVSFTEPYLYLLGVETPFNLGLSGFYFNRRYFDWDEQRLGGRVALGYRLTHDLLLSTALRAEEVKVYNPRVRGEPELDRVIGDSALYTGQVKLTRDTRDLPFFPTEGSYTELSFEQGFGTFDYPRAELDYRQYFLVRERPDGSGRHTLGFSSRFGVSGSQTPIYENFYAGGYSTLRGFDFRGASPIGFGGVQVGGELRFLGSVEYFFPLTADDMIKGVVFCDFGTVEEHVEFNARNYRVAPGAGLRIAIPALGPAPLALDFAVPVAHAPNDDIQNFSFFIGINR